MSANKYLIRDGDFEYDTRMSEETKMFVSRMLKIFKPSEFTKTPLEILRTGRLEALNQLNQGLKFENLKSAKEIFIRNPVDDYKIPATVFIPKEVKKDSPIVVYYHGGGWAMGSRASNYHACASLASKSKTIWISIEYRLAPEHKFNTQMTDYVASFEFVEKNRDMFSSKRAKLGVAGDSAGGHIAAILAHKYKPNIDFQVLIYPIVDLATHYKSADEFSADCYSLVAHNMSFFIEKYLEDPKTVKSENVSPIFAKSFTKMPKCLIISAELDPLIDRARAYHDKILEANSWSELKVVRGSIHGFFSNGIFCKQVFGEAQDYILEFLDFI